MNRQPNNHAILLLVLACLLAGWVIWRLSYSPSLPPTTAVAPSSALPTSDNIPTAIANDIAELSVPGPAPSAAAKTDVANTVDGDFVLAVGDADDLAELRQAIANAGGRIRGELSRWGLIRVQIDHDGLQRLLNNTDLDISYEQNYVVQAPPLLPRTTVFGTQPRPFNANGKASLGIESDNSAWGDDVRVAIIDTGVEAHPSLEGVAIEHIDLLDPETASNSGDYSGHGTAVASIIAGQSTDLHGIAPAVSLLSIRVLGDDGVGDSFTIAEAIVAAVDQGSDIINLSLGTYGDSKVLRQAVAYAVEQGVTVVAASGNDAVDEVVYPARYDGVVGVSAVDAQQQHVIFANSGEEVDIAAPGVGIHAAWSDDESIVFDGTSAAVPMVVASLAATRSLTPQLEAADATTLLYDHSDDAGAANHDPRYGHGSLNLNRVLERDQPGIYDIAVADHYIHQTNVDPDQIGIEVTVENRGTEPLASTTLAIAIGEQVEEYELTDLAVGESRTVLVSVSTDELAESNVRITSTATVETVTDRDSQNNTRAVLLRLTPDSP